MREFAKFNPQFWINGTGRSLKRLGMEAQLTAIYCSTNPHAEMIGIYYLPITFIAQEIGFSADVAAKTIQILIEAKFCSYDYEFEYIWVHDMAFEQVGTQLKIADKKVKSIHKSYLLLPKLTFLKDFYLKYETAFHLNKLKIGESQSTESEICLMQAPCKEPNSSLNDTLITHLSKEKKTEEDKDNENENKNDKDNDNTNVAYQQTPIILNDTHVWKKNSYTNPLNNHNHNIASQWAQENK